MSWVMTPTVNDDNWFEQTCNKPYDRHYYKVVLTDGQSKEYHSWEQVRLMWFQTPQYFKSHVEVLDYKKSKGFK